MNAEIFGFDQERHYSINCHQGKQPIQPEPSEDAIQAIQSAVRLA
jgi:hypothetical protein